MAAMPIFRPPPKDYVGNIRMILDLKDPARPEEVGAGGFRDNGRRAATTIRGPTVRRRAATTRMRMGRPAVCQLLASRLSHSRHRRHVEAEDHRKRQTPSPTFPHPTHTCLPIPPDTQGPQSHGVADEDVAKLWPSAPAFTWI